MKTHLPFSSSNTWLRVYAVRWRLPPPIITFNFYIIFHQPLALGCVVLFYTFHLLFSLYLLLSYMNAQTVCARYCNHSKQSNTRRVYFVVKCVWMCNRLFVGGLVGLMSAAAQWQRCALKTLTECTRPNHSTSSHISHWRIWCKIRKNTSPIQFYLHSSTYIHMYNVIYCADFLCTPCMRL
jgi:hypothetical protein